MCNLKRPDIRAGLFILCFTILFLVPQILRAQWKAVIRNYPFAADGNSLVNIGSDYAAFYFLQGPLKTGLVSTDDTAYMTTDGGETWHGVPNLPVGDECDWVFKDTLTGWSGSNPCYKTTDGGQTWFPLNDNADFAHAIYFDSTSDGLFFSATYHLSGGTAVVSRDEGLTWEPQRNTFGGFAFANGDTGIESGYSDDVNSDGDVDLAERTTDGGHTWQEISWDSVAYRPLALAGTNTYFDMTPLGTVMRSDDIGQTWRNIYSFPFVQGQAPNSNHYANADMWFTNSCILGDINNLYVVTVDGAYHSSDTGHTWNYLCGMPTGGFFGYDGDEDFYVKDRTIFIHTTNWDPMYGPLIPADSAVSTVWRLNLDSMQYFPTGISFTDGTKRTTTTAGNQITVNYALNGNDTIGIDTGHLVFHYDPNELILENLQLPPSWVILDSSTNNGVLNLTIAADSNAMLPTPIIQLMFGTYLSNNSAKVYLDSANLSGHRLNCGCEALSMTGSDSVQINFEGCGDSLILAAMNDSLPFYITNIAPNPASSTIEINLSSSALVAYTLFDALGRSVLSNSTSASSFSLDVLNVPSGIYYLRVASNNYVQSRSISITR